LLPEIWLVKTDTMLQVNVTGSYWDKTLGLSVSAGGTGKTTADMMMQENYTGWDFENTWTIQEGKVYP